MDASTLWDFPGIDGKRAARIAAEVDMNGAARPQRLADMLSALDPAAPLGIDAAIELLAEDRRCAVKAGATTRNSAATTMRDVREGFAWAQLEGAESVDEASDLLDRWVTAPDLGRRRQVQPVSVAAQHRRRRAVRFAYTRLRAWGITAAFPAVDATLPARIAPQRPILTDDDVSIITWTASQRLNTVQPTTLALAAAGVTAGEVGFICGDDVDTEQWQILTPGSGKSRSRTITVRPEHREFIQDRLETRRLVGIVAQEPLAYRGNSPQEHVRSAMASKAIASLGRAAGVPLTIGRLNAWAALQRYTMTGRIEDVAHLLGLRSLDAAARVIGLEWQDLS